MAEAILGSSSWKAPTYRPWPTKRTALVNGSTMAPGQALRRILRHQQRILIAHSARQPRWDVPTQPGLCSRAVTPAFLRLADIVIGGTGAAGQPVRCLTGVRDAASRDHSGRDRRARAAAQR